MLGLIRISFACLDRPMFLNLYLVLVRPHLEYCVQAWSPYKRKYIKRLEGVQRRATKLVPELRDLEYPERLRRLGLTTLEERRARGDMIQTYKFVSGKEDINPSVFFQMAVPRPGANSRKIFMQRTRLNVRKKNLLKELEQVGISWKTMLLNREKLKVSRNTLIEHR